MSVVRTLTIRCDCCGGNSPNGEFTEDNLVDLVDIAKLVGWVFTTEGEYCDRCSRAEVNQ